jgi:hypothetical protein
MSSALAVQTARLAAAVANTGTVVVPYPAGFNQAALIGSTGGFLTLNNNDVYQQLPSGTRVNFTFGASDITITNNTGVSWPIGSDIVVSFGRSTIEGRYVPSVQFGPSIVALTVTVGTAGNTVADVGGAFAQATLNNNFRVVADKINEVVTKLKAAGIDVS